MGSVFFFSEMIGLEQSFPLRIVRARQADSVTMHGHEYTELAFVAQGNALHTHVGRDGKVRRGGLIQGDIFSILPGERHGYEGCGNMVLYNIYLYPELFDSCRNLEELPGWKLLFEERSSMPEEFLHLSAAIRDRAAQALDHAIREEELTLPGYETAVLAQFLAFLVPVLRAKDTSRMVFETTSGGILSTISMMEGNPERKFTLEQLAKSACMSIPSYTKKFRAATGNSPNEYLQKVRLQKVLHYLISTDLSIAEIAGICGFCSANYLIKQFRRDLQKTPSQYKREYLKKNRN